MAASQGVLEEELQVLGKLIRDLNGYIKMRFASGLEPVRENLLPQARQLLELTGI